MCIRGAMLISVCIALNHTAAFMLQNNGYVHHVYSTSCLACLLRDIAGTHCAYPRKVGQAELI